MLRRNKIVIKTAGLLFTLAVLLPNFVHLAHAFEIHEQTECTDNSLHIHEGDLECEIHDFQFSSSNFQLYVPGESFIPINYLTKNDLITYHFHSTPLTSFLLRGPPMS